MKRVCLVTLLSALLVLVCFTAVYPFWVRRGAAGVLKVGFIYENDGSTPHTYNFQLAEKALRQKYPEKVEIYTRSNVLNSETEEPLRELIRKGCSLIFTNGHSSDIYRMAEAYPEVQFCQIAWFDTSEETLPGNYHTFKGEIYQGWYVTGIAAGMKLQSMIEEGKLTQESAVAGFVGAERSNEAISAYTAFILGIRSVCPGAVLKVRYCDAWSNFTLEKKGTTQLIEEGCVVLAAHCGTIGPALACEEAALTKKVYYIGYNRSAVDIAPNTALTGARINWEPYITGAVEAVMANTVIEKHVEGNVHGNDMSAGFEKDWIQLLEVNTRLCAAGTEEAMQQAVRDLKNGKLTVFKGNYIGKDPDNPKDTIDLSQGFEENKDCSFPAFHYILKDVVTIVEENALWNGRGRNPMMS